jgi:Tfp pilus assembly protein PilO
MRLGDVTKIRIQSKWAVLAAPGIIAVVAMYNWIVAPQVTYLRAVQKYEPVISRMAKEKTDLQDLVASRRKELKDLENRLDQLRPALYTPDQARQLWSDLETMAVQQGCAVMNVSLGTGRPLPASEQDPESLRIEVINTTVTITGEYDGIMAFVGQLQAQPRKIWVAALGIEAAERDPRRLQCRAEVSIYVIYQKEAVPNG